MKLIMPSCRANLTEADLLFICSILSPEKNSFQAIEDLLKDTDTCDLLLESEKLFEAILQSSNNLSISTHLYFYVLVNHALHSAGIHNEGVADYIASLLADKVKCKNLWKEGSSPRNSLFYGTDLMAEMQEANHSERFFIMAQIANQSLFFAGIFPQHIKRRCDRRAAPSLSYYESLGSANYRAACDHRLAQEFELERIFGHLSEHFVQARKALNEVGETLIFLNKDSNPDIDQLLN